MDQRAFLRRLEPAEFAEVLNSGRFESQDDFSEVEPLYLRQFLLRSMGMLLLGPEAQANSRRRPSGASGALVGRSAADFLDQKRINAAIRIVARDPRNTAVDNAPNA